MAKENKIRGHGFREKLSDNKLAKFQLIQFFSCQLGVESVRLTFWNVHSEKTRKIYFFAAAYPQQDYNTYM